MLKLPRYPLFSEVLFVEYKDHILNEAIRQAFLECRRKRSLTQNRLSILSNITRQFISQVEAGKRLPSIITLSALAKAYNKSLSDFFREVDRFYRIVENNKLPFEIETDIAAETRQKMATYINNAKKQKGFAVHKDAQTKTPPSL